MNLAECKNCSYPDNDNYEDCCNSDCEVYIDMRADIKINEMSDDQKDDAYQCHLENIREEKLLKESGFYE